MPRTVVRHAIAVLALIGLLFGCSSSGEFVRRQPPEMGSTSAPPVAVASAPALASVSDTSLVPASAPELLTKDGSLYRLAQYRLTDSGLLGTGTVEKDGATQPFSGSLSMADVEFARDERQSRLGKALLAAGAVVAFTVLAASSFHHGSGLSVVQVQGYHEGSPPSDYYPYSCPLIYSYDGRTYHLESETYSGAVFKAAEHASYDNLERLRPVAGGYRLKLANESNETEWVNDVRLLVVDAPTGATVVPDPAGRFHTLQRALAPLRCVDEDGRDALSLVRDRDGRCWESALDGKDLSRDEALRDGLVLDFTRPEGTSTAKLVVRGINTKLGNFGFEQLSALKGKDQLRWYQQLDRDPTERGKLTAWMKREGMLHVKVWQDGAWVEQTALPDVGPRVDKDQVAVLDLSHVRGDVVRIELESATDLWRIDRVALDDSQDLPVEITEVQPASALDGAGKDVTDLLRSDDDRYLVTVKGDTAQLVFEAVPARAGRSRSYAVSAKGYYQRWFDTPGKDQAALADRILAEPLFGSRMYMPIWKSMRRQ